MYKRFISEITRLLMEGHCHPVVNTGKVTDCTGTTEMELVDTRPECSCMTMTVSLTLACLLVAAVNLQVQASTHHKSTGRSISDFLHQHWTTDWPTGIQSNRKLFTMACNESYPDGNVKSIWTRVTIIQEVISTQQTAASSSFFDKLLITQL